jgi:hypothetical protein
VFFLWLLLGLLTRGCEGMSGSDAGTPGSGESETASGTCPERVADALPDGEGAELVDAYTTKDHRIVLCRNAVDDLYYFGEFKDKREKGIAMPAEETDDGYEAYNDEYHYVISGDVVDIYRNDTPIAKENLTPDPSPT